MSKIEAAVDAVRAAFFTSTSERGKYYLTLRYPTMKAMHDAHDALLALASPPSPDRDERTSIEREVGRLRDILDTERYKVAAGVQAIARAVQGREWLSEPGRGSYTYDDERYQQEFGAALDEINAALKPLRQIAQDWSDCPRDPLCVAANRSAALNQGATDVG